MSKEKAIATFKIGGDEIRFEANLEAVEAQIEKVLGRLLQRDVAPGQVSMTVEKPPASGSEKSGSEKSSPAGPVTPTSLSDEELVDQFFDVTTEGRLTLQRVPKAPGDVLLLVLFGIGKTQDSSWVTAPLMVKTARAAGARFERADRVLAKRPKLVQSTGQARARRYQLTTEGEKHCRRLVQRLLG